MSQDRFLSGYSVGYGKPPKHSQFKPGRSGNPGGRPRGRLNYASVLERELREKVLINENGHRRTITKLEAGIKQLVNQAAGGDLDAIKLLATLVRSAEDRAVQNGQTAEDKAKDVEAIRRRIYQKLLGPLDPPVDSEHKVQR